MKTDEEYLKDWAEYLGGGTKEELLLKCEDLLFNIFGENPDSVEDPVEKACIALANCRRLPKMRVARWWLETMVERGDPEAIALWREYTDYVDAVFEEFTKGDDDVSE